MEKREDFKLTGALDTVVKLKSIVGEKEGNVELLDILSNLYQTITRIDKDNDMKQIEKEKLCGQILDYMQQRITLLKEFFESSYVLRWNSSFEKQRIFLEKFKELNQDEEKSYVSYAADRLETHYMSDIKIIIHKFFDKQYIRLEIIKEDMGYTDKELHNEKGTIFHNEIRDTLSFFIEIYNEVIKAINDRQLLCMGKGKIEDIYNDSDEIVVYNNYVEKSARLQKILDKINLNNHGKIEIFFAENDNEQMNDINTYNMFCRFMNGYMLDENAIYELLEWDYEMYDQENNATFAAQIHMSHIIFLLDVSENLKNKLKELKTRCNIKCYYFKKLD